MSQQLEKLFDKPPEMSISPDLQSEATDHDTQIPHSHHTIARLLNSNTTRSDTSNLVLFDQGNDKDYLSNYLTTRSIESTAYASSPILQNTNTNNKFKVYYNTWTGVYIPCIHACLGITVFLRLPWIIGFVGIKQTFIYLYVSQLLMILTCSSVAAIASNGLIIGGPYYMISRALGKEIGVSIGIILWLSLCISSTIYISGSSLLFASFLFPGLSFQQVAYNTHVYGSILLILLTLLQLLNKHRMFYINMLLFAFVILALTSLLIGFATTTTNHQIKNLDASTDNSSFFYYFCIFFPTVSNIMPGLNRSGSLKSPAKALQIGLLTSIVTTTLLLTLLILLYSMVDGDLLRIVYTNELVLSSIAWPLQSIFLVFLILVAVGAACYCYSGANALLQSMSMDNVLPILHVLKKKPIFVILSTGCISLLVLQISNFEILSTAASLCHLLTFCFLNWSTALLGFLKSPGWRPSYKYHHWSASLLGGIMSLGLMFCFDWRVALGSLCFMLVLIGYIQYYGAVVDWGDALFALNLQVSQRNLVKLEKYATPNVKNWRPQLLGFSAIDDTTSMPNILGFLSQIKKGRGLTIIMSVIITDDLQTIYTNKEHLKCKETLQLNMQQHSISGFAEVLVSRSLVDGIAHAVQLSGLGKLSPNTVVMGYLTKRDILDKCEQYVEAIKAVLICKKGLILIKTLIPFPLNLQVQVGTIDVYWIRHDGGILSILPHLLKKHHVWRKCKLRIFALAELTDNSVEIETQLREALRELRIEASSEVIELGDSDISEFTYERTLQLQERQDYLKKIKNNMKGQRKNSIHLFIRDDESRLISPYMKKRKL